MENKNNAFKYITASVILLLIGTIIGVLIDPYLPASLSNSKKGYQVGFSAAETLVQNSSLGSFFRTPATVNALQGTVTSMHGNSLTLHISPVNPFDDPAFADRTVTITASTTIYSVKSVDPKVYQAEMVAFIKTQPTVPGTKAPSATISLPMSLSNIAVGDSVGVITTGDVKTVKEFTAQSIQIFPMPVSTK
jgi:hypothetical protein